MTPVPARLDATLVASGRARSRRHATELVQSGRVLVDGAVATKPARAIDPGSTVVVTPGPEPEYASRGAYKLLGALERWPDVVVEDAICLDAGASTGGFTDVLLRRGARLVHAVDVGHDQLVPALRDDARVRVREGVNVRDLRPGDLDPAPGLVVGDLAFISLTLVLEQLVEVALPGADVLLLVKPQFEVGRERLGSGGVVRGPELRREAVLTVVERGAALGLRLRGVVASPLPGPSGNVEYFVRWTAPGADATASADGDGGGDGEVDAAAEVARAIATGPVAASGVPASGVPGVTDLPVAGGTAATEVPA